MSDDVARVDSRSTCGNSTCKKERERGARWKYIYIYLAVKDISLRLESPSRWCRRACRTDRRVRALRRRRATFRLDSSRMFPACPIQKRLWRVPTPLARASQSDFAPRSRKKSPLYQVSPHSQNAHTCRSLSLEIHRGRGLTDCSTRCWSCACQRALRSKGK